jgi:hypothetical protein
VASQNHYLTEKVEVLLASAHDSVALVQGADVRRMEILNLLKRWALVREQIQEVEIALAARVERCPPAKALLTIPEIGAVCAATIVAELGTPADYQSPRQVLKLAGISSRGRAAPTAAERGNRSAAVRYSAGSCSSWRAAGSCAAERACIGRTMTPCSPAMAGARRKRSAPWRGSSSH